MTRLARPKPLPPSPAAVGQRMTFEQYLTDPTVERHSEWVDGEVVPLCGAGADGADDGSPLPPLRVRMTYEQFLTDPAVPSCAEWVDGEVIPMPPIADPQADLGGLLTAAMRVFVEIRGLGAIRYEPYHMRVLPDLPSRSPDLMFIATRHLKRMRRLLLDGPADLVVEIVSPESQTRDRVHKFAEYERGGVPEYWLIDPDRRTADFFRRGRQGKYKPVPPDKAGVFRSKAIPGVWIDVAWLWRRPLPSTVEVLKAWGAI